MEIGRRSVGDVIWNWTEFLEIVRDTNWAYSKFKVGTLKIYTWWNFEHLIPKILFKSKQWGLKFFLFEETFQRGDLKKLGSWVLCHPDVAEGSDVRVSRTSVELIVTFSLVNSKREYNIKRTKNVFFVQFTF